MICLVACLFTFIEFISWLLMMMMFIGTETLVTQLENERSRVHATEVPATGEILGETPRGIVEKVPGDVLVAAGQSLVRQAMVGAY